MTIDRAQRTATFVVKGPADDQPWDIAGIEAAGAAWYPLALARELKDAILTMRTNELEIGLWLIKTEGDPAAALAMDATLQAHRDHWLVRETIGYLRRTFSRLDVASRSLFACRGRLVLRGYALRTRARVRWHLSARPARRPGPRAEIALSAANFGDHVMASGQSRLARRSMTKSLRSRRSEPSRLASRRARRPKNSASLTSAPDDIDWSDEVRLASRSASR